MSMTRITYFHEEKCFFWGSSVKCVDAFRIAIKEKTKLLIKQKHG